jgi:acid phosphatase
LRRAHDEAPNRTDHRRGTDGIQEVDGSIPFSSTISLIPVSDSRSSDFAARGRGFVPHLCAALGALTLTGCASAPAPAGPPRVPAPAVSEPSAAAANDQLDALAWFQTAEEARRLSQSVFVAAARALDDALADPSWSALGQGAEAAALPAAVIADVDETLLDNSALQARFVAEGIRFDERIFAAWVEAGEAEAVPGAREFAELLRRRGVTLFYVTNRDDEREAATRRNLERAGFALSGEPDVVLTRGERPEWGSDKESRRQEVARAHRVLLLLGDDLNDFVSAYGASLDERRRLAEAASARWGTSWFVLPNPLYGSWERALVGAAPQSRPVDEVRAKKRAALRGFEPPSPPEP